MRFGTEMERQLLRQRLGLPVGAGFKKCFNDIVSFSTLSLSLSHNGRGNG
jgi:hypothetical protein